MYSRRGSEVVPGAGFGRGSGPIHLAYLTCTGTENSVLECTGGHVGAGFCDHKDDVGVRCQEGNNTIVRSYVPIADQQDGISKIPRTPRSDIEVIFSNMSHVIDSPHPPPHPPKINSTKQTTHKTHTQNKQTKTNKQKQN